MASLLRFIEQGETSHMVKAVAAGADRAGGHRGRSWRVRIERGAQKYLRERGRFIHDFGTHGRIPWIIPITRCWSRTAWRNTRPRLGLLVCTTGIGMSITANKVPAVRAAMVAMRNPPCSPASTTMRTCFVFRANSPRPTAKQILDNFLNTEFEGGRHERRVNKMETKMTCHLNSD
jgi:RpiB/LacA/LacB family sugar-phosphate isomerase